MSHVKAGGATRQASPRPGKRRGIKKYGGEKVTVGQIIVRQVGTHTRAGVGVGTGFNLGGGPSVTATLEVLLGRGPKPPGGDVYDARAIRSTLMGTAT